MPHNRHNAAPRIYLASRSPRRRELLTQIGVAFDPLPFRAGSRADDEVDETPLPGEDPAVYVRRVAQKKGDHGLELIARRRMKPQLVLSADTTVAIGDRILGKPRNAEDASAMLHALSGTRHQVLTAVAIAGKGRTEITVNVSQVRFRRLDADEIHRYIASGEPMDKAGAYGIQGRAGMFVEHIEGSYTGIMGLPLFETAELLKRFGHPL